MYRYFYFPDRIKYDSPERTGLPFDTVAFNSSDGTHLSGWFIPAVGVAPHHAKGSVIHMHGNAQNMTAHWTYAEWLPHQGYNLFTFDYRGYGNSHGSPEPQGMLEDAIAALDHMRHRNDIDTNQLFVFGQSLGGMLAIAAAASSPQGVRAVLAEAPVHSYSAWAEDQMPEKELALDDTHCASSYIAKLAPIPLLLIHSLTDRVVPYSHSTQLFSAASEPKHLETLTEGEHNDAMTERHGTRYQDLALTFFAKAG
ncbi:MAG: alpha/beta hydrolase [Rhodocyclaceae bacterium]|nr:alpha/beta hydrolase [Rhodocyclaceae bacterium]